MTGITMLNKPPLQIYLANPRGFCAGVVRAIDIVNLALNKYGTPIYVRHEIVHNHFVVDSFERRGVIFVEHLSEVPDNVPLIFSAHGVSKLIENKANSRELTVFDATCPLVKKVHHEAFRLQQLGHHVIIIGHKNHAEVQGIVGQLTYKNISIIENIQDAETLDIEQGAKVGYVSQTTLSVDDTANIIKILKRRFPGVIPPKKDDICYATSNRQEAVKIIADISDMVFVIGATHSSNTQRLLETARNNGCPDAQLIESTRDIDWSNFSKTNTLGISTSASAPDELIQELIDDCRNYFDVSVEDIVNTHEDIVFKAPIAAFS